MRLYHATLKSNLDGIIEKGIDPSFSKGAEQVIWLHTAGRREWAILHTTQRHPCEVDAVMIIAVNVPRSKLRRRWRGLWSTTETNDPHGEHDFGSIQLDGCLKVFWKIDDYSDASMDSGADDKLNAYRVRVIMLADEY